MTNVGSLIRRQKICPCVIARSLGKPAEKRKRCRTCGYAKMESLSRKFRLTRKEIGRRA